MSLPVNMSKPESSKSLDKKRGKKKKKVEIPLRYILEGPKSDIVVNYCLPKGRVRRLVTRLTKTDLVPLNDPSFFAKINDGFYKEEVKARQKRIKNRYRVERDRVRRLCIDMKMDPPSNYVEEMNDTPVYRINRTIKDVKDKFLNSKNTGITKIPLKPIIPVEPFAETYRKYWAEHPRERIGDYIPESVDYSEIDDSGSSHEGDDEESTGSRSQNSSKEDLIVAGSPSTSVETLSKEDEPHQKSVNFAPTKEKHKEHRPEQETLVPTVPETPIKLKPPIIDKRLSISSITKNAKSEEYMKFVPYISGLVDQVYKESNPNSMFETGNQVMKTFNRQTKAANKLIKKSPNPKPTDSKSKASLP